MTLDLQRILDSKRAYRRRLAARPVAEKLRILDALRERTLGLRRAAARPASHVLREDVVSWRTTKP